MLEDSSNALLQEHGPCMEPHMANLVVTGPERDGPRLGCLLPSSPLFRGVLPRADHLLRRVLTSSVAVVLSLRRVYGVDSALQRSIHFYLEEAAL